MARHDLDAELIADETGGEVASGARSAFRAGEGALRRRAAEGADKFFAEEASVPRLLRAGGLDGAKTYAGAVGRQIGRNLLSAAGAAVATNELLGPNKGDRRTRNACGVERGVTV